MVLGVDGISDFDALHSGKNNDEVQLYAFDILALTVMTCVPLGPVHFTCCGTDCGHKLANDGEDTRAIQD